MFLALVDLGSLYSELWKPDLRIQLEKDRQGFPLAYDDYENCDLYFGPSLKLIWRVSAVADGEPVCPMQFCAPLDACTPHQVFGS